MIILPSIINQEPSLAPDPPSLPTDEQCLHYLCQYYQAKVTYILDQNGILHPVYTESTIKEFITQILTLFPADLG